MGKTKEKVKRLSASGLIKSEEEYKKAKERLEGYIKEYNWLKSSEEPAKEVEKEARNIIPMISSDNSENAQKYYLNYSQYLINKKTLIESGEYESILMQNIQTLFVQTKQYEIDSKEYSTFDIIKGLITRDANVLEDWKMDRLLSKARIWEGLPKEKDSQALSIQPVKHIMKYISKYYEIVGLNLEVSSDENTLPALSAGYLTPTQEQLIILVNDYMKSFENERGNGSLKIQEQNSENKVVNRQIYDKTTRLKGVKIDIKDSKGEIE